MLQRAANERCAEPFWVSLLAVGRSLDRHRISAAVAKEGKQPSKRRRQSATLLTGVFTRESADVVRLPHERKSLQTIYR